MISRAFIRASSKDKMKISGDLVDEMRSAKSRGRVGMGILRPERLDHFSPRHPGLKSETGLIPINHRGVSYAAEVDGRNSMTSGVDLMPMSVSVRLAIASAAVRK
jgi:hypothetical protein